VTIKLYAALDVSLNKAAVCVMDHEGGLVREIEVAICPDALADVLRVYQDQLERVGLEAGRCRNGWCEDSRSMPSTRC
jgi:transposase